MGKGLFLMTLAEQNPDINYIGIEKYSSVLLRALQKMEITPLPNIRFIRMDAEEITEVFEKEEEQAWYCANCGHVHYGKKAPGMCPVCNHPQAYFEIKKSNF